MRYSAVECLRMISGWEREKLGRITRRWLGFGGPQSVVNVRWQWPFRKPYERAEIRLYSLGGGVGDELMCTPIFREIRRLNPGCQITFLSRYPEMFRSNPNLHAVERYSAKDARGAFRLSYVPVPPRRPLITRMAECIGLELEADQLDAPEVSPSLAIQERIAAIPQPRVIIQPQASRWTPNKSWPLDSWRELIEQLVERFEVVEVGTAPLFPGHDFGPRFHGLAGETSLADFVWTISQGAVFVGPPSGGMHIANSFRVPSVIIFGGYESPAGYFYPRTTAFYSGVPCAPCWLTEPCPYSLKCLHMIPAAKVFRGICGAVEPTPQKLS